MSIQVAHTVRIRGTVRVGGSMNRWSDFLRRTATAKAARPKRRQAGPSSTLSFHASLAAPATHQTRNQVLQSPNHSGAVNGEACRSDSDSDRPDEGYHEVGDYQREHHRRKYVEKRQEESRQRNQISRPLKN